MSYYPLNLSLKDTPCLVVGGGQVAERKCHSLLSAGAKLTVCSPEATATIQKWAQDQKLHWKAEAYNPASEELSKYFLIIAATDQEQLNREISKQAKKLFRLVNNVTEPEQGNFSLPASIQRGPLLATISTSGQSPALARKLRSALEENLFTEEQVLLTEFIGSKRSKIKRVIPHAHNRRRFWNDLLESDFSKRIQDLDSSQIEHTFEQFIEKWQTHYRKEPHAYP